MTPSANWLTTQEMAARTEDWRDLAARAVEPNVFAEADYMLPALRHLDQGGISFLAVEREGRLAGVLPLRLQRWRWGLPFALAIHHVPYAPHGTPLVEADGAEEVCAALLRALAAMPGAPRALLLPHLSESGAFAAAWRAAARREGRTIAAFDPFARPALVPDAGDARATYLATRLSRERRRRLEALPRRIAREYGPLAVEVARTPAAIAGALETFMALEASGWKGRRGTAIGAQPQTAAFFRESLERLADRGQAEILTIQVAQRTIAGAILARSGGRVWFYKTAYDETLARSSPGVAVDLAVTDHLLADPGVALGDSLTTVPDARFDRMWCERLPMADWLVELDTARSAFGAIVRLEAARRGARQCAKAALEWTRARMGR